MVQVRDSFIIRRSDHVLIIILLTRPNRIIRGTLILHSVCLSGIQCRYVLHDDIIRHWRRVLTSTPTTAIAADYKLARHFPANNMLLLADWRKSIDLVLMIVVVVQRLGLGQGAVLRLLLEVVKVEEFARGTLDALGGALALLMLVVMVAGCSDNFFAAATGDDLVYI